MGFGRIIKGVGSFYDVMAEDGQITRCRMRGSFRNKKIVPAVGDWVEFTREGEGDAAVVKIFPRASYLTRPVVANATQGAIVCAVKNPEISYVLLDKMLINNERCGLKSLICFNKCDLADHAQLDFLQENYRDCGAKLFFLCAKSGEGLEKLKEELAGQITLFSGVSGAGKSTLLSKFFPMRELQTGELSEKIQRGKHTTRHSELMPLENGAYLLDTPGFSSLELADLSPDELWRYYKEFYEYSDCKFNTCLHLNEPQCGVKSALEAGEISSLRYENYRCIYEELKKNYKAY